MRPNYTIHESGHLFLSPDSFRTVDDETSQDSALGPIHGVRHPILDLIANATQQWSVFLTCHSQQSRLPWCALSFEQS